MPKKSIRLRGFSYQAPGPYFVTLVEVRRQPRFGKTCGGVVCHTWAGKIVADAWERIGILAPGVLLDAFVVMPDHFHGILTLLPESGESPPEASQGLVRPPRSLGSVVAQFKATTTRLINAASSTIGGPVWQHNYYEHIIRGQGELERIRRYIITNPARANRP
jgi:REP element-mobilizing transposase RayT